MRERKDDCSEETHWPQIKRMKSGFQSVNLALTHHVFLHKFDSQITPAREETK